jgi:three-Cys-motif partner protein
MRNETLYGTEDGLLMNEEVGAWSPDKYKLLQLYAYLFTNGMRGKWSSLTYVDMYSGAGLSRVKGTNQVLLGSPLIALSLDYKFSRYIFCEADPGRLLALKDRVARQFPGAAVTFIEGDCNDPSCQIANEIPKGSLTLCFVDPYDLGIQYDTLRSLNTDRNMDFLCLINSRADAGRNPQNYTREDNSKVDAFLGGSDWRKRWESLPGKKPNFGDFLCNEFDLKMQELGYLPTPQHEMAPIKNGSGVVIYHLALFARHEKAKDFWKEVVKYATSQRKLFE